MKIKDVAKKCNADVEVLAQWVRNSDYSEKMTAGIFSWDIDDKFVDEIIYNFKQEEIILKQKQEQVAKEQERVELETEAKTRLMQQAMADMLITSGFNFDGYRIVKYSGYISGDSAISMDRPTHGWLGGVHGNVGEELLGSLSQIRRKAIQELKEAAYALGCNAVIGVDFDYLTLDPQTATNQGGTLYLPFLFAVTANGNAVVIEKN